MPTAMPAACNRRWPPRGGARRRGFTLLEVLVALTILAVALTAALRGAMALTNNARDIDLKLYAVITAENQLRELRLAHGQVALGDTQFDCAQGGIGFVCTQTVSATPNPFFRRIEVHVATAGADGHEYADLMGLLPVN